MSNAPLENVSKIEPAAALSSETVPGDEKVDSPGTTEAVDQAAAPTSGDTRRSGLPGWLFLVTLLVAAGLVGWQFQIKGQLETQIAGLQTELRDTQALLGAHKTRLGEIRSGVRSLSDQLGGLLLLVEADPGEGVALEADSAPVEAATEVAPERRREIPARLGR